MRILLGQQECAAVKVTGRTEGDKSTYLNSAWVSARVEELMGL